MHSQFLPIQCIILPQHNSPQSGAQNQLPTCRHITTTTKHYDWEYLTDPSPSRQLTAAPPQASEPKAIANISSAPERGPTRRSDCPTEHWKPHVRSAISRQPYEVWPVTFTSPLVLTKLRSSALSNLPKQGITIFDRDEVNIYDECDTVITVSRVLVALNDSN
jgi:hypothetical protein